MAAQDKPRVDNLLETSSKHLKHLLTPFSLRIETSATESDPIKAKAEMEENHRRLTETQEEQEESSFAGEEEATCEECGSYWCVYDCADCCKSVCTSTCCSGFCEQCCQSYCRSCDGGIVYHDGDPLAIYGKSSYNTQVSNEHAGNVGNVVTSFPLQRIDFVSMKQEGESDERESLFDIQCSYLSNASTKPTKMRKFQILLIVEEEVLPRII